MTPAFQDNERRIEESDKAQLERLRAETDQALEDLPEQPSGADVARVLKHFRLEYATHANINGHRLDASRLELRRLRLVLSGGMGLLAVVLLVLALIGLSYQHANTNALCSFRDDLQKRVTSTTKFLQEHPKGIPGIPAGTLRVSLINEQHTLDSLSALKC